MTNDAVEEWGDVSEVKSKKGVSNWLLFCGGGCLIATILTAAAGYFGWKALEEMRDPEVFWPKVDELVHVDSPMPERFMVMMSLSVGDQVQRQFLDIETGLSVQVISPPDEAEEETRASLFSEDPSFTGMLLSHKNSGMMTIQGREVRFVDTTVNLGVMKQRALFIDVTSEGGEFVLISLQGAEGGSEIPREDIDGILQFFHIGPDR